MAVVAALLAGWDGSVWGGDGDAVSTAGGLVGDTGWGWCLMGWIVSGGRPFDSGWMRDH